MPDNQSVFVELIDLLQSVKDAEQMPDNLFDELINAALAVGMNKILQETDCTEKQAFAILQQLVNKHFEAIKG